MTIRVNGPTKNHKARIVRNKILGRRVTETDRRDDDFNIVVTENENGAAELTINTRFGTLMLSPRRVNTLRRVLKRHFR